MMLDFNETRKILKKYGIDYEGEIINTVPHKINFPVVLKTDSKKIIHKTEKNAVITGINEKAQFEEGFHKLRKLSQNVLIQKQQEGIQVIIGMKRDAQFGPVILFGLGGVMVEIMKDVSLRIAPVDDAEKMIKEIKGYKMLEGYRGGEKANIKEIVELIQKISKLSLNEDIQEIDLNPVIVNKKNAHVVDARIIS